MSLTHNRVIMRSYFEFRKKYEILIKKYRETLRGKKPEYIFKAPHYMPL